MVSVRPVVGQERGQGIQGGGCLRHIPQFDPVAEQHDLDQQGQLSPEGELVIQDAQACTPQREKADGDGERDE